MAAKDDASTDIERRVKSFAEDMSKACAEIRKERLKLQDADGGDGWGEKDAFHLEIPDSKVPLTDERAETCMAEYARLTREKGQKQNTAFENKYGRELAPYLKKYE